MWQHAQRRRVADGWRLSALRRQRLRIGWRLPAHDAAWRHRCRCLDPGRFVSHRPWVLQHRLRPEQGEYAAVTSTVQGFRNNVDRALRANSGRVRPTAASSRVMPTSANCSKVGVGYQLTPQLNLGAHYFRGKQSGGVKNGGASNGNVNFYVAVADYAFSKRTDAYFGVDHTSISGGALVLDTASGAAAAVPVSPWYSSPLLITGGEKRCSGNRVGRFQGNRVASDSDPVFSFWKNPNLAGGKKPNSPPTRNGRGTRLFSGACSGGMAGTVPACRVKDLSFSACVLENHRSLPETSLLAWLSFFAF